MEIVAAPEPTFSMWEEFLEKLRHLPKHVDRRFVYFVLAPEVNKVKIGIAKSHDQRLISLQSSCPVELQLLGYLRGDAAMEKRLHKRFAEFRVRGEWFDYTPIVQEGITQILKVETELLSLDVDIVAAVKKLRLWLDESTIQNGVFREDARWIFRKQLLARLPAETRAALA